MSATISAILTAIPSSFLAFFLKVLIFSPLFCSIGCGNIIPELIFMQINEEQKKAIEHKNGPLLVVAGAGTGKTRVITERIKWLIDNKKANPQEILALTFTDKAANEMSDRIDDVMPIGYEEPFVNTFHAFSDRILKKEGLEIGLDPSYKVLAGPEQWLLLRKHLFDLDIKYFRPLGNPTKFISAILKLVSRLQDENISVGDFENFVDNFEGGAEEKDRWRELGYIYKRYQEIKIENSKMDFGDLITWTIKLFSERPNILKKYQTQFKHVLVDEFQDTNYAQYQMVKMICPQELGERSLLAVGDDSQSIYKFRGAAVSNILEFMKDYPSAQMITLINNYRSTQKILDAAYKLIQNNNPDSLESKLGLSKKLISQKTKEEEKIKPEILQVATIDDEVELVISKIYEVLAKEPTYTYKDIAILARANNHLDAFVMALRKHGLPYQLVGNRGLYDQDEIRNVVGLLKIIVNPKDSSSLYRVLNIEVFNIDQKYIAQMLSQAKHRKVDLWEVLETTKIVEVENLKDLISTYQNEITKKSPVEFIYSLVHESGYLNTYLEHESIENNLAIKNLDLFLNIVKRFEIEFRSDTKNIPTVLEFLDYLELVIDAGDNPAQAEIEDIDTINLLTVHSAKGLEFPVVFMINLVSGRFPTNNRGDALEMPEELIKEALPTGDEHVQEERRLFYVGMTRAEKYLYLTLAKNYGGKTEKKPSGYLTETGLKIQETEVKAALKKTEQRGLFGVDSAFRNPQSIKTDFTPSFLSYSQIETYKTCALKYKYSYVLNVPTAPGHALSFGTTIHDTLRDFHQKKLFGDVSYDEMLNMYEKNWHPLGYLDEKHRQHRFEDGKELLKEYYERHKNDKKQPEALEKSFNLKVGGIKFFGRIDRIDKLEGGVEIIDYKTGTTKTQKEVDEDDQVAFYAIAAKEALGMVPEKLTYYFLESGERISTFRTDEQLKEKKEEVVGIIEKIKKGNFEARSGMHCNWCDFREFCPYAYKG